MLKHNINTTIVIYYACRDSPLARIRISRSAIGRWIQEGQSLNQLLAVQTCNKVHQAAKQEACDGIFISQQRTDKQEMETLFKKPIGKSVYCLKTQGLPGGSRGIQVVAKELKVDALLEIIRKKAPQNCKKF